LCHTAAPAGAVPHTSRAGRTRDRRHEDDHRMNLDDEPAPALLARHDGEAQQWDFGTGLPPGPAGVVAATLSERLTAYVDLADPGALPRVTVDEPADDDATRDAVARWLGADAQRVLDHAIAPTRTEHRVLVP